MRFLIGSNPGLEATYTEHGSATRENARNSGIAGAFVAGWLFTRLGLGLTLGGGIVGAIIAATLGAVVLLLVANLIQKLVS
jgi:hypothetical protein